MSVFTHSIIIAILSICLFSCDTTSKTLSDSDLSATPRSVGEVEKVIQIFLVRHAEKSKDDPRDPNLSEAGHARAAKLKMHLEQAGITQIYTSDYRRTKQTIGPLAEALDIVPTIYNTDLVDITDILRNANSGNIIVAGHSNTTPKLANKLLGESYFAQLDESVYDHLFVITKVGDQCSATLLKY